MLEFEWSVIASCGREVDCLPHLTRLSSPLISSNSGSAIEELLHKVAAAKGVSSGKLRPPTPSSNRTSLYIIGSFPSRESFLNLCLLMAHHGVSADTRDNENASVRIHCEILSSAGDREKERRAEREERREMRDER